MSFTKAQIIDHLEGLGHGTSVSSITNLDQVFERAASRMLLKVHPIETMRSTPLASFIYDDVYNYGVPYDFGSVIDLIPQADRQTWDTVYRDKAGRFDLRKALDTRVISVEGSEGSKILRINWRGRKGKVLNTCDSLTANGTWAIVGTASGLMADSITKYSGGASIRFDSAASGDGIKNISMTQVDMTDEDEVADIFIPFYLKSAADVAKLTSATFKWGNDLTTNFWTGTAQTTQADGSPFKLGWNVIKVSWSTATETGTVNPVTIDAAQITFATTAAISDIRVDSIIFTIGRAFDLKYYSKYLFKGASSGLWISSPGTEDDLVLIDNDTLPIFLDELLKEMAKQVQGADGAADFNAAESDLQVLYPAYKGINPSQLKKVAGRYGSGNPARGRWGRGRRI